MTPFTTTFRALALGLALATSSLTAAYAAQEINVEKDGTAAHGYDVVAYFNAKKPVKGTKDFTASFGGGTYLFASAANRDAFTKEPAKYAPQYGGYCAFGTAQGAKVDVDPTKWAVVDGKLYLNYAPAAPKWNQDPKGYIVVADHNWKLIEHLSDEQIEKSPPKDLREGK